MTSLAGKSAVVLGASAANGSGWAIAESLAKAGADVIVAARSFKPLERLASQIGGYAVKCDAGKPTEVAALFEAAKAQYGKIDIAVNAAGHPVVGTIAEIDEGELQLALDVNYLGNVHFVRHAAASMNDGGSIVLITSYSAVQPIPPHFAYACAKAAADCLVRYAALEYGHRGIRVNSILPGPIKSDMSAILYSQPGVEATFAREVPLGRIGIPADYADAVLWLAGPAFISGAQLPINGGNHLTRMPRTDELPNAGESYLGDSAYVGIEAAGPQPLAL